MKVKIVETTESEICEVPDDLADEDAVIKWFEKHNLWPKERYVESLDVIMFRRSPL